VLLGSPLTPICFSFLKRSNVALLDVYGSFFLNPYSPISRFPFVSCSDHLLDRYSSSFELSSLHSRPLVLPSSSFFIFLTLVHLEIEINISISQQPWKLRTDLYGFCRLAANERELGKEEGQDETS